jgi:hypothetical protein
LLFGCNTDKRDRKAPFFMTLATFREDYYKVETALESVQTAGRRRNPLIRNVAITQRRGADRLRATIARRRLGVPGERGGPGRACA